MIKYYNIENTIIGKGFITHSDQEVNCLAFSIIGNILKVTCETGESITSWVSDRGLVEVDSETAEAYIIEYKSQSIDPE